MLRTRELIAVRPVRVVAKKALVVVVSAIGFLGSLMLVASTANAQEARTAASMAALIDKTAKLGAPKIEGEEKVGGKSVPVLYFGGRKGSPYMGKDASDDEKRLEVEGQSTLLAAISHAID